MDIYDHIDATRAALRPALAECDAGGCANANTDPVPVDVIDADALVICGVCGGFCTVTLTEETA